VITPDLQPPHGGGEKEGGASCRNGVRKKAGRSPAYGCRAQAGAAQQAGQGDRHLRPEFRAENGGQFFPEGGDYSMTTRQETICRKISAEIKTAKAKCQEPTQENYIYWCGYRDGLDKAHELAQYATEVKRDPLLIPMIESGVHNTNYKG
jgi:hypothetical protein